LEVKGCVNHLRRATKAARVVKGCVNAAAHHLSRATKAARVVKGCVNSHHLRRATKAARGVSPTPVTRSEVQTV